MPLLNTQPRIDCSLKTFCAIHCDQKEGKWGSRVSRPEVLRWHLLPGLSCQLYEKIPTVTERHFPVISGRWQRQMHNPSLETKRYNAIDCVWVQLMTVLLQNC